VVASDSVLEFEVSDGVMATVFGKNIIAGREEYSEPMFDSRSAIRFDDIVGRFPVTDRESVRRACEAAKLAFPGWASVPAPRRGVLIGRVGQLIARNKETLAWVLSREIGKPLREARGEVQEAIDTAEFFQSEGRRLYGQTVPSEMPNKTLCTMRRPLGVCAMITAGNFPFAVPSWKIIPALLAGNTVVWKPSEDAPTIAYLFARLLLDSGLPPGVLNIVNGPGANGAGEYLIDQVDEGLVDKVSFTGSTQVGRRVGEVCGRNLQIPSLELGGKNPMVVLPDADIDLAVEGALFGGFGTAGQRCTSLANLIVIRSIADEIKQKLLLRLSEIQIGDPLLSEAVFYGPLINERFYQRFMEHIEVGQRDGARMLTVPWGRITSANCPRTFVGDPDAGFYVFPTVWHDVRSDMNIAQNEIFGPTINIIEVDSLEEAIRVANGTPYGLSSSIYTRDAASAYRFKTDINAGMTSVNNSTSGAEAHLPFGGVKASGNGTRESGVWVLDAYTRWQAINEDFAGQLQLAQIDVDIGAMPEPTDLGALRPMKLSE
jgi:alpha-ketoglutaric semialdehyde dehydrogenase